MNIDVNRIMYQNVESSDHLPGEYKDYQINGAKVNCISGDFGIIINQTIPSDSWRICMHLFFLNSYTWIQFPMKDIYPLIMYNYRNDLKIYIYVGPDKPVKLCLKSFLEPGIFNVLAGDYPHIPMACEKGSYHFFTVAGHLHQIETILQNPILSKSIFPELIKMLTSIARRIKEIP